MKGCSIQAKGFRGRDWGGSIVVSLGSTVMSGLEQNILANG